MFRKFTNRQLDKDPSFAGLSSTKKKKLEKKYRLRLGAISSLMFLNDVDYKETQKLVEELKSFGLEGEDAEPHLIFKGFFFIHKDKSTGIGGQSYIYEFIHKSFSEFLAADFLIRIFLEKFEEEEIEKLASDDVLRFIWGYNWLHKHYNITRFVFEHTEELLLYKKDQRLVNGIIKIIKSELKQVLGTKISLFPISDFNIMQSKPVLEHFAIYTQNLILFWVAIQKGKTFPFNPFNLENEHSPLFKFENQKRTDINENKTFWKKVTNLWELSGNSYSIAKLKEWVSVKETEESIHLAYNKGKLTHNFSDAAQISCNDYELLLSFTDYPLSLQKLNEILISKPEFCSVIIKIINDKFDFFFKEDEKFLLNFTKKVILDNKKNHEVLELLRKLYLYYPYNNDLYLNKINRNKRYMQSAILESSGVLLGTKLKYNNSSDLVRDFDSFSIEDFKRMGINHYLHIMNFIVQLNMISFLKEGILTRCLICKVDDFIIKSSIEELIAYIELTTKVLWVIRRRGEEKGELKYSFLKILNERIIPERTKDTYQLQLDYEYMKSYILYKLHFGSKKYKKNTLPNQVIEDFFYNFYIDKYENIPSHMHLRYLELLGISLKSPYIKIKDRPSISMKFFNEMYTTIFKEGHTSYHYIYASLTLDLLTSLSLSSIKYTPTLVDCINQYQLHEDRVAGNGLPLMHILKLLYVSIRIQKELSSEVLNILFSDFYDKSNRLKSVTPKMRLQYAILLLQNESSNFDDWAHLTKMINSNKRTEELKSILSSFSNYNDEIFEEFNNEFYYEINCMDNIPHSFLRGSLLHRDKHKRE